MLRSLLILLILLNLGYWIWHRPELVAWHSPGIEPGREPARLKAQVNPQSLRLLSPAEVRAQLDRERQAASAAAAASAASMPELAETSSDALICLQTAALNDEEYTLLTARLQEAGFSRNDWEDRRREFPGRWGIHFGPYEEKLHMQQRVDVLRRLQIDYEELNTPPKLAPGLLLGRFKSEEAARKRLVELNQRGLRGAKVEVLEAPSVEHRLRIDALTSPQATRVRQAGNGLRWDNCET